MRIFFTTLTLLFIATFFWTCTNLNDAEPSKRKTFIRIYDGPSGFEATDLLVEPDGYVILGNMQEDDLSYTTVVIKTDRYGNQIGETGFYPNGTGKSIKPFSNSSFSGYLILGDVIKVDPNAVEVGNIEVIDARILGIEDDLTAVGTAVIRDPRTNPGPGVVLTDYSGKCLSITDNSILLMNTQKVGSDVEKPYVVAMQKDLTLFTDFDHAIDNTDTLWINPFSSVDQDKIIGKSIHYHNNALYWANSSLKQQGSFDNSYIEVIKVIGSQAPETGSSFDLGDDKRFIVNDMQPGKSWSLGFGLVGTFGESDGSKKNMFFTRANPNGTIRTEDVLFIDAALSLTEGSVSTIEDTGEAITNTHDAGFVLAGTMLTTSVNGKTIGKGARDIFLVKIDRNGKLVWKKLLGGAGDEVVSKIIETPDNGLLISGTNTLGGYGTIFLIKTDKNGELKN